MTLPPFVSIELDRAARAGLEAFRATLTEELKAWALDEKELAVANSILELLDACLAQLPK